MPKQDATPATRTIGGSEPRDRGIWLQNRRTVRRPGPVRLRQHRRGPRQRDRRASICGSRLPRHLENPDATGQPLARLAEQAQEQGFAGGVKRHHFHGGPKTHGQSDRHRAPGSIGAGTTPGRVIKGLRMAGHMGNAKITSRILEVVSADPERNILLVKGTIPGARNSLVILRKQVRRKQK